MGKPTEQQLAKINRFAKEPLTAENTYVHKFRMIGTRYMPSRFLKIDASLLPIYQRFINNGDVVQIADHSFGSWAKSGITLPFGRYFDSEIVTDEKGDTQLDAVMYMAANQKTYIENFTTDDISGQLDAGILDDSSVSISWGKSECSVCGNDYMDYENCPHYIGQTYKVNGVDILCHLIAKPAEVLANDKSMMIENSIVCAGAYPDAGHMPLSAASQSNPDANQPHGDSQRGLTKLNNLADLKLMKLNSSVFCLLSSNDATVLVEPGAKKEAADLHQLYHRMYSEQGAENGGLPNGWTIAKLVASHAEAVKELVESNQLHELKDALDGALPAKLKNLSKEKGSDNDMEWQQKFDALTKTVRETLGLGTEVEITPEAVTSALSKAKETATLAVEATVRTALKIAEETTFADALPVIALQAEQGEKFRADTIEVALASGVRDQGNSFQADTYKKMFEKLSVEEIQAMGATWETSAVAKLGGRRNTTDGDLDLPDGGECSLAVDDSVYTMKK